MSAKSIVAVGCVAVLAFDATAAIAAETFDFSYSRAWPTSLLIWGGTAWAASRAAAEVRAGALAGLAVAATDATVGWSISWLIGPGMPDADDRGAGALVATVIAVALMGGAVGALAGFLGRRNLTLLD